MKQPSARRHSEGAVSPVVLACCWSAWIALTPVVATGESPSWDADPCDIPKWNAFASWQPPGIVTSAPRPWLPAYVQWSHYWGPNAAAVAQIETSLVDKDGKTFACKVVVGVPDLYSDSSAAPGVCVTSNQDSVWIQPDDPLPLGSYVLHVKVPSPDPLTIPKGCDTPAAIALATQLTISDSPPAGPVPSPSISWTAKVPTGLQYPAQGACASLLSQGIATACPNSGGCCTWVKAPSIFLNMGVTLQWPNEVAKLRYVVAVWRPSVASNDKNTSCFSPAYVQQWLGDSEGYGLMLPKGDRCLEVRVYDLISRSWSKPVQACTGLPTLSPLPRRPSVCDPSVCDSNPPEVDATVLDSDEVDTLDPADVSADGVPGGGDGDPDLRGGAAPAGTADGCQAGHRRAPAASMLMLVLAALSLLWRRVSRAALPAAPLT